MKPTKRAQTIPEDLFEPRLLACSLKFSPVLGRGRRIVGRRPGSLVGILPLAFRKASRLTIKFFDAHSRATVTRYSSPDGACYDLAASVVALASRRLLRAFSRARAKIVGSASS